MIKIVWRRRSFEQRLPTLPENLLGYISSYCVSFEWNTIGAGTGVIRTFNNLAKILKRNFPVNIGIKLRTIKRKEFLTRININRNLVAVQSLRYLVVSGLTASPAL